MATLFAVTCLIVVLAAGVTLPPVESAKAEIQSAADLAVFRGPLTPQRRGRFAISAAISKTNLNARLAG